MKVFKPPYLENSSEVEGMKIFLGGSIEMGKAVDWQKEIAEEFKDYRVTFYNPRRDDWNPAWKQTVENKEFKGQVDWEMDHIEESDLVIFYIQGDTLSPITLGEIYYMCAYDAYHMIVACEPNFWRRGNLEVMSDRHGFTLLSSLGELKQELHSLLDGRWDQI